MKANRSVENRTPKCHILGPPPAFDPAFTLPADDRDQSPEGLPASFTTGPTFLESQAAGWPGPSEDETASQLCGELPSLSLSYRQRRPAWPHKWPGARQPPD